MDLGRATLGCVLLGLVGLAACDRPGPDPLVVPVRQGPGKIDPVAMDASITLQVKAALRAEHDVNAKDISVVTRQGQVTLSGSIPARQIARAEAIARGVDGVQDVDNQLRPAGILV